jgi:lipid A 3-O-deacylase
MKNRLLRGPSSRLRARRRWLRVFTIVLAAGTVTAHASDSLAPDEAALTGGYGKSVSIYGLALRWDSLCACADLKAHGFETRLDAQVAYWHAHQRPTDNGSLWDTSLTPVLRWSTPDVAGAHLYIEAGVGAHILSATRINNDRVFSTAFQFGEDAGTGVVFGDHHQYEFGVYVQHVSNARIKEPNNGLTYLGAVLRAAVP